MCNFLCCCRGWVTAGERTFLGSKQQQHQSFKCRGEYPPCVPDGGEKGASQWKEETGTEPLVPSQEDSLLFATQHGKFLKLVAFIPQVTSCLTNWNKRHTALLEREQKGNRNNKSEALKPSCKCSLYLARVGLVATDLIQRLRLSSPPQNTPFCALSCEVFLSRG